jgi:uncharacterized protein (TIGR03089 family)
MTITDALLGPLRVSAPSRPLITHYDDAAGTRVELSVATMANWAAKTANWLVEEHDIEPGSPVAVLLPAHWQTFGILLGAWWCGAHVTAEPSDATVAFVPPTGTAPGADTIAAVSLDPMGRDLGSALPSGMVDYLADARIHGDDFLALTPVPGNTPALAGATIDDVVTAARSTTLEPGARLLSTVDWTIPEGVRLTVLRVLAAGASLVQITNPDPTKLDAHRAAERSTAEITTLD